MELYEMKQSLSKNQNKLKSMGISLDLDSKKKQIEENNQKMQEADFWNDQKAAQKLIKNNKLEFNISIQPEEFQNYMIMGGLGIIKHNS